jgi:ubiquinone biosynthesis protein
MFIFRLIHKLKILKRFNAILLAFFGAGFSWFIYRLGLKKSLPFTHQLSQKKVSRGELPRKFREVLEKLGPVFVKFGQILSTRQDILPKEYIQELEKLQNSVPPFSFIEAKKTIESDLNKPLEEIFEEFSAIPFASASLGQVYKAKLFSGQMVAVKVQRPKAKELIKLDTEVLLMLAHWIDRHLPDAKGYNLIDVVQEFRRWTLNELDYKKEAANCEIFSNFFKNDKHIYGPKVFWQYSSGSVLTLEFVNGISLGDVVSGKKGITVNKKLLAHTIADSFVRQFFEYGFFHADPHPGNIFILPGGKVLFLDFGMVGFLDEKLTGLGLGLFLSLIEKDIEGLVNGLLQIQENYGEAGKEVDVNGMRRELNQLILQWPSDRQAGNFTLLLSEIMNTAIKHGVGVPTDFSMLGKSIVTLDSVVKQLDGEFSIERWEQPLVEKILSRKLEPKALANKVKSSAFILEDVIKKLPETTATVLDNLEKGNLGAEVSSRQLLEYEKLINANSKINTHGTLLAAVLIASALIFQIKGQPEIFGLNVAQIGLYGSLILITMYLITNLGKEHNYDR